MNNIKGKILIVLPHLRTGGGENLALNEAIGLKSKGCNIKIICISSREKNVFTEKAENNKMDITYLGKSDGFSLKILFKLVNVFIKEKPKAIHTHLRAFLYVSMVSILFPKIKFYHTIHSLAEKEAIGIIRILSNIFFKTKKFTPIAISKYCARTIAELYEMNRADIPVIYNGVDTNRFKCEVPYDNRKKDKIIFVSTGRFQAVKRHDLMIDAFAILHQKYPNTELWILGDGELRKQIEEIICKYKLQNSVILKGIIKNVEDELNKAHIYLACSDFEGLPLSVLEAMSCGLPIVTTKAGGTIDIVDNSIGILCDINNKEQIVRAMIKFIENVEYRKSCSANANAAAIKYDISKCVQGYYDILNS